MSEGDYTWRTSGTRTLIQVDDEPTVVCINDISAMVPTKAGKTEIILAGGPSVITDTAIEDIMQQINDTNVRRSR